MVWKVWTVVTPHIVKKNASPYIGKVLSRRGGGPAVRGVLTIQTSRTGPAPAPAHPMCCFVSEWLIWGSPRGRGSFRFRFSVVPIRFGVLRLLFFNVVVLL